MDVRLGERKMNFFLTVAAEHLGQESTLRKVGALID